MTDDAPERSPTMTFATALSVPHNATVGVTTGVGVALAVFVFFVIVPGAVRPTPYYLVLAFTLAFAVTVLVTVGLTLVSAYRLTREG